MNPRLNPRVILSLSLVSRRLLFSIFLAGVCLAVLATRVETEFRRHRYIVRSSSLTAQEPTLTVTLPDLTRLAGKPTAIVLRLRGGDEPTDVNISLDTTPVTRVTAPCSQGDPDRCLYAGGRWRRTTADSRGHSSRMAARFSRSRERVWVFESRSAIRDSSTRTPVGSRDSSLGPRRVRRLPRFGCSRRSSGQRREPGDWCIAPPLASCCYSSPRRSCRRTFTSYKILLLARHVHPCRRRPVR